LHILLVVDFYVFENVFMSLVGQNFHSVGGISLDRGTSFHGSDPMIHLHFRPLCDLMGKFCSKSNIWAMGMKLYFELLLPLLQCINTGISGYQARH